MITGKRYVDKIQAKYEKRRAEYLKECEGARNDISSIDKLIESKTLNDTGVKEATGKKNARWKQKLEATEKIQLNFLEDCDQILEDARVVFGKSHGNNPEELDEKLAKMIDSGMLKENEIRELLKKTNPTTFRYCVTKLDTDKYSDLHYEAAEIAKDYEIQELESYRDTCAKALRPDEDLSKGIANWIERELYEATAEKMDKVTTDELEWPYRR